MAEQPGFLGCATGTQGVGNRSSNPPSGYPLSMDTRAQPKDSQSRFRPNQNIPNDNQRISMNITRTYPIPQNVYQNPASKDQRAAPAAESSFSQRKSEDRSLFEAEISRERTKAKGKTFCQSRSTTLKLGLPFLSVLLFKTVWCHLVHDHIG